MSARCPHCGRVDWTEAPTLRDALDVLWRAREATSAELADALDCSLTNAVNKLNALLALGVVRVARTESVPGGGRVRVFAPVTRSEDA